MPSKPSSRNPSSHHSIDKLDFDANRKPPASRFSSFDSEPHNILRDDESFFSTIVTGAIERDRRKMASRAAKYVSFASAILSCLCAGSITAYSLYGPLFLQRLSYSQFQVNAVSTTAELAMYLPVPLFGYLCDRYNPRPLSLAAGALFGAGYLLAALTYRAGLHTKDGEGGWPFAFMVVAFVGVGAGTSCMYLSAVTTCAKNFGRGKHKGLALAMPIAAFGLSGMWQSQVGSHFFKEMRAEGRGDIDVFRYFLFLGGLLFAVGLVGAVGLRVVNEEEMIDEAVDELERSGLLEESPFFQRSVLHDSSDSTITNNDASNRNKYGTMASSIHSSNDQSVNKPNHTEAEEEAAATKKTTVLNAETRLFLTDPTTYLLAAGFFLTTGPGEAFINNLGTLIHTLYPPGNTIPPSNTPATHVSILALTSTLARLLTGTLSDLLSPTQEPSSSSSPPKKKRYTLSRLPLLLTSTLLFSLGQLLLATPLIPTHPTLLPLISALVGLGYGAIFSLTPMIVSVVWGVQNFGTNWGIVAVVPAAGAALWGAIYSGVYQMGVADEEEGGECFGGKCWRSTFFGMAVASWVALGLWVWAWRGWRGRGVAV